MIVDPLIEIGVDLWPSKFQSCTFRTWPAGSFGDIPSIVDHTSNNIGIQLFIRMDTDCFAGGGNHSFDLLFVLINFSSVGLKPFWNSPV